MFQSVNRRVSATGVLVVIALVFALTGGAYAAKKYLITSTAQISPKVLKAIKGKNGANGVAGLAGQAGAQGPAGAKGDTGGAGAEGKVGPEGKIGPEGKEGPEGKVGPEGKPGPFTETLPTGGVLTGTWIVTTGASKEGSTTISFPFQLKARLDEAHVNYVTIADLEKEEIPQGCGGTAEAPVAEAGFLCVFEGKHSAPRGSATNVSFIAPDESKLGTGVTGCLLSIEAENTESRFIGTWVMKSA
jgi:hypothetical protein